MARSLPARQRVVKPRPFPWRGSSEKIGTSWLVPLAGATNATAATGLPTAFRQLGTVGGGTSSVTPAPSFADTHARVVYPPMLVIFDLSGHPYDLLVAAPALLLGALHRETAQDKTDIKNTGAPGAARK
jgi:hypothetical protein